MSMTARFVQVTPDLLAHLLRSPSSVTELLAPDEDAQIAPVALTDSMRQDWLRRMPQLLAGPPAAAAPAPPAAAETRLGAAASPPPPLGGRREPPQGPGSRRPGPPPGGAGGATRPASRS